MFLYYLSNLGMGGGGVTPPPTTDASFVDPDAATPIVRLVDEPGADVDPDEAIINTH